MVIKPLVKVRVKQRDLLAAAVAAALVILVAFLASGLPQGLALGIPLACGVFALAVLHLEMFRRAQDGSEEIRQIYPQLEALLSIHSSLKLDRPLPPMRGWAISPDAARILVSEVLRLRPVNIMEFGSGASTILLAACLRQIGKGKLWSIEQAEEEAEKSLENLRLHGLTDWVTVVVAPLRPIEISGETWVWYDLQKLPSTSKLDLLVVDGPSYLPKAGMRYVALPVLEQRLSDNATIILDDAAHSVARQYIGRWLREFPDFRLESSDTEKGTAVLRRKRTSSRVSG